MAEQKWAAPDLRGKIALVTGASRGVGRGVAVALGGCGATVYVTGRSSRGHAVTEDLPGSVDETAEHIDSRGGTGIPIRCDHGQDLQVEELFSTIERGHRRLDLLVNNAWSGYERSGEVPFDEVFWRQPMWRYDLFAASLRGYYLTARLGVPLMLRTGTGLIVNIGFTDRDTYLGQVAYDMVKNATDRMTFGMARELSAHSITAMALHPGFVATERVQAVWEALGEGPARILHSPEYVGRAVAGLLADPDLRSFSGSALAVGDLAERYDFTDVNGLQPPAFRLEGMLSLATRMERLNRAVARSAEGSDSTPSRGGPR
ncbi:SDR family NAD(P)-dependent oxidoreductase [Spirillospora sp. NPDC047279]|uniref:SDR family NAD(P)-dependent oxidoreductase n=1 Tax=Spirillospora sp. NPDC047279 TaxID=3155478 RepID=UPI0033CA3B18